MNIDPNLVLFYVNNPFVSAKFYERVLGSKPIESSPSYVMFVLKSGLRIGLWAKSDVEPKVTLLGGGSELSFQVNDFDAIDTLYARWQHEMEIAQVPTLMDFGYTFVILDPDHHRLRFFALKPELNVSR